MQCQCGGTTVERVNVRGGVSLHFDECRGCGRCGAWLLFDGGALIARGKRARQGFNEIAASVAAGDER